MFINFRFDLKDKARVNRSNMTYAEKIIWYQVLRKKTTGYRFLRQKPIDNYIVDFYAADLALIVEIDDDSHLDCKRYDAKRSHILNQLGFKVIRYTNGEVISDINLTRIKIQKEIFQRKTELCFKT